MRYSTTILAALTTASAITLTSGAVHAEPQAPGRRRHRAVSSKQHSGWLEVTHPFHPLAGRRVEVLYSMRRGGRRMFVVDNGTGARMTVPVEWIDRGPAVEELRVSQETLVELRMVLDALAIRHCADQRKGRQ